MRYLALATDYDGTLALNGRVDAPTIAALERLRASGRKLIMVTGRELDQLLAIFPEVGLFDWVVAENGALLYQPSTKLEKKLAESPPPKFVDELKRRGVGPISVGRVIVATWEPHETTCLRVIRDMALELEIIFNKGAVMILPTGVNKATGLRHALEQMGLSVHNVVGTGDAENDHAFLSICECGVAVSNALPALKDRSDIVTAKDHGAGVCEVIEALLADDLTQVSRGLSRHHVSLGKALDKDVMLRPHGRNILVAGTSGGGKSSAATGVIERLMETGRQLVMIDPEGDYDRLEGAMTLGNAQRTPTADEVLELLAKPGHHVVVNLLGLSAAERPAYFLALLPRLQELRQRTGRPHWIAVDEAQQVLPVAGPPASDSFPVELRGMIFITLRPSEVSAPALNTVDTVIASGKDPEASIVEFMRALGEEPPELAPSRLSRGEVLYFSRADGGMPQCVTTLPANSVRPERRVLRELCGEPVRPAGT